MRIARYRYQGLDAIGLIREDGIVPAAAVDGLASTAMRDLIRGELPKPEALASAVTVIPLPEVEFLLPAVPEKILCAGVNFPTHRVETGRMPDRTEHQTIFTRFVDSFVPHEAPLQKPSTSDQYDYECELAIVIGRTAHGVPVEDALDHVFGYSCLNDGTVRDWQTHTAQWIPGKNWYRSGAIGPWIVTADEFGAPAQQVIQTRVNGEVRQSARLEEMIHSVAELVSYCSAFTPLHPGDIIAGGTTGGVGKYMNPPGYLVVGDVVEVEIEGIGILRNTVRQGP